MKNRLSFIKTGGSVTGKGVILQWLENRLSFLQNGKYTITIEKEKKERTNGQLKLMWMWFRCLSNETGNTPEDFHNHYCRKYLKKPDPLEKGEIVVTGTKGLTTKDMDDFLACIQADAAIEFGITLPTPDDLRWGDFEIDYK